MINNEVNQLDQYKDTLIDAKLAGFAELPVSFLGRCDCRKHEGNADRCNARARFRRSQFQICVACFREHYDREKNEANWRDSTKDAVAEILTLKFSRYAGKTLGCGRQRRESRFEFDKWFAKRVHLMPADAARVAILALEEAGYSVTRRRR